MILQVRGYGGTLGDGESVWVEGTVSGERAFVGASGKWATRSAQVSSVAEP